MKRISKRLALVGLLGWFSISLVESPLLAQDNDIGGLEIVNLTGQLEAIVGNQIKIVGEDKTVNIVFIGDDTTFTYSGTADPSVLEPGLLVRFTAAFDQNATPQAPLTELEIFRPLQGRRLPLEVRQGQTPGVYPVEQQESADVTAANKSPQAKKTKPGANAVAKPAANNTANGGVQTFHVVGMLRAVQGDRLQIVAGNQPLIVQASPDLKITVSAGDSTFCQPGDEVKLNALKHPNGLIQADTIQVTGAKPLGAIDPKAMARNSRPNKRGQSDEKMAKPNDKEAAKQQPNKQPRGK